MRRPRRGSASSRSTRPQASFESGSRLLFNTELNDASVQHTDLLVLSHAITDAPGGIVVTNFDGAGGETGARDGIRLVEAMSGATTTPNNFTLLNGELRAGAFTYDLFRGGVNPSNFRMTGSCAQASSPHLFRRAAGFPAGRAAWAPDPAADAAANPLPPGVAFPIIGPELATYGWCSRWPGSWGFRSSAPSTTGSATPTSPTVAPFSPRPPPRRLLRSTCRPRSRRRADQEARACALPALSPSVWGRFFGQTIDNRYRPSPIRAPAATWAASRAASIFCADL